MADDGSRQRKPDFRTAVEDIKAVATMLAMEAEFVLGRRAAQFLGILALFVVVVGTLLFLLDRYINPNTAGERKDLILTLAQILGGTALLLGLYFTWRGQRITQRVQEENQGNTLAQLENARNELELTRRGQITERFTQAIGQLGSEDLELKLGGIYSLERTAYEDRDHHWPVMEVLTTYVRQHATRDPERESSEAMPTPEPDIQAILTVIGQRSVHHRDAEHDRPIKLNDTDLRGADLRDAYLRGADLAGTDLRHASLAGADLQRATVEDTNFRGAYLGAVNFRNVYFMGTNLEKAVLEEADLRTADLSRATGLAQEQLDNALGDSHTIVPLNLQRPALWTLEINEQRARHRQLFENILKSFEADHPSYDQSDEDGNSVS